MVAIPCRGIEANPQVCSTILEITFGNQSSGTLCKKARDRFLLELVPATGKLLTLFAAAEQHQPERSHSEERQSGRLGNRLNFHAADA
jgi:hypothetical protein